ncbi:MAG: hypothetical protein M3440_03280 [Chloroflexota bacterium]|nr:hypothetical protein [Chloroflexota bacterium]
MATSHNRATTPDPVSESRADDSQPIDADESGALAIGLMVAIVGLVALLTLALFISIP